MIQLIPKATAVILIGMGLATVLLAARNLKKLIGLAIFQSGIFLVFMLGAYRDNGTPPVVGDDGLVHPLPHAFVLTAIVVGVSMLAVGLGMVRRIQAESSDDIGDTEPS